MSDCIFRSYSIVSFADRLLSQVGGLFAESFVVSFYP